MGQRETTVSVSVSTGVDPHLTTRPSPSHEYVGAVCPLMIDQDLPEVGYGSALAPLLPMDPTSPPTGIFVEPRSVIGEPSAPLSVANLSHQQTTWINNHKVPIPRAMPSFSSSYHSSPPGQAEIEHPLACPQSACPRSMTPFSRQDCLDRHLQDFHSPDVPRHECCHFQCDHWQSKRRKDKMKTHCRTIHKDAPGNEMYQLVQPGTIPTSSSSATLQGSVPRRRRRHHGR